MQLLVPPHGFQLSAGSKMQLTTVDRNGFAFEKCQPIPVQVAVAEREFIAVFTCARIMEKDC